ncbi:MAG TPA: hypothetical protein VFD92_07805 [Candidatus Binatia bacterium]|nr:hypothetical protein [Candidatus Binatia bacterium]
MTDRPGPDCERADEALAAIDRGDVVAEPEIAAAARHLDGCARCSGRDDRSTRAILEALAQPPPEELRADDALFASSRERVMAAIADERVSGDGRRRLESRPATLPPGARADRGGRGSSSTSPAADRRDRDRRSGASGARSAAAAALGFAAGVALAAVVMTGVLRERVRGEPEADRIASSAERSREPADRLAERRARGRATAGVGMAAAVADDDAWLVAGGDVATALRAPSLRDLSAEELDELDRELGLDPGRG